jgi:DNA invertase Pin-like site-specific DNA recombinase
MEFCTVNNISIDGWIEETISGAKAYNKRRLGLLLRKTRAGDTIICSELSRLGRNLFMIMEILSLSMQKQCRIWTIKEGYKLGDDIQSKVLAFAFGLTAEIERKLIAQRTKEALARVRAEGKRLGRPKGVKPNKKFYKMHGKEALIRRMREEGFTFAEIAKITHVSRNTIHRYYNNFIKNA